ncbi:WXG100 family type VII secretion target [Streptomyces sp. NPDC059874]|uniref:WXG100 family type VII secretion target n=1 Tax=Streptomyces sp. NPDC059874 TaxID=3346983 RepID=UPI00364D1A7A
MATTFDGYSHQQLRAMIAGIDPETVQARADQLKKASDDIAKIAEKLKNHVVTGWEGEGATAYQEWVGRAGNATLRLSEYSKTGSEWMGRTVQLMHEAAKMPVVDADATANLEAARKYHNDPDAPKIGADAQKKLDSDHREAVRLMNNLAQSYEQSSGEMNKAEVPTFPPPPEVLVPQNVYGSEDMERQGGGSGGGGSSSSPYTTSGPRTSAPSDPGVIPSPPQADNVLPPRTAPDPQPQNLEQEVDVDLDTVGTLPPPTTQGVPPATPTPQGPPPTGPGLPTPGPFVPPMTSPPIGGLKGPGPLAPLPGTSGPLGKLGGPPGLPPRDTGIMGGRQVTTNGPSASIPRGTVIGEGPQAGRAMGGGMGHGPGASHGPGGSPVGRRLAMEPGGVVGGRQAGAGNRLAPGGQPFTQGGSGLVRNSSGGAGAGAVGHAGAGARTAGNRRDDQGGDRPDYLAEDEETWQGNRRVVPPVID